MVTIMRWTGREARLLRETALRMTIRDFAAHTNLSTYAIRDFEVKGERANLRTSTQKILDKALASAPEDAKQRFTVALESPTFHVADVAQAGEKPSESPEAGSTPQRQTAMISLRSGLVARRRSQLQDVPATTTNLKEIRANVDAGHAAYQRADYAAAAKILITATATSEAFALRGRRDLQRQAYRVLAIANIGVSKLAGKLGDSELAWLTADRAATVARIADDQVLAAAADYQVACALLGTHDGVAEAAEVVALSREELSRHGATGNPSALSVEGALLLLAAIVSARQGDGARAARHLVDAEQLAAGLGQDGNHLFTAFGPTNLMIHQVSVAVELQNPGQAISVGEGLDTSRMPAVLLGRRAQVHLDLATAFSQSGSGDAPAVLHLLEAERIAPQIVSASHKCRTLLTKLLGRERRSATPGLRGLAQRAGVLG